jgi:dTDP-4-dehydrorhamnose reductase
MKVLVTGKHGQLARSLSERAEGLDIITVGRPEVDLEMRGALTRAITDVAPQAVINAAAYTAVDKAEDESERAFRVNAEAAAEAARAARAIGAPIIQISTDYVFGGQGKGPYSPDSPPAPLGVYGRSKLAGEEEVRRHHPDHLIVRTAWVYSAYGSNFLLTMMRAAERRDTVRVVADQRGNPSLALDLADGLLAILRRWRNGDRIGLGDTYHLAGTGEGSWADFAEAIFAESRKLGLPSADVERISTSEWPTKVTRPADSTLDSSKFARDFGFQMPEWRSSVARVVNAVAQDRHAV